VNSTQLTGNLFDTGAGTGKRSYHQQSNQATSYTWNSHQTGVHV